MPVSLATKDFVQGGLLNDVDVTVLNAKFVIYDYDGKATFAKDPPLALKLTLKVDDDDSEHTEYVTGGSSGDFVPTEEDDGDTITRNGTAKNLRKNSNLFRFNESLEQAGFPQAQLALGKASAYTNTRFHLERRPMPKSTGLTTQDEQGREKTYIACGALISTQWDKGKKGAVAAKPAAAPAKGSAKAAPKAVEPESAEEQEVSQEMLDQAAELMGNILEAAASAGSEEVLTQKAKMQLFRTIDLPQDEKNALVNVCLSADLLGSLGWKISGKNIVPA